MLSTIPCRAADLGLAFLPSSPSCGPFRASMTAKNKYPRGKSPKRSLGSRKREKDVSGALLENCFQPEKVEIKKANWENAVPRKMQIMMRAAVGTPRQSKGPREDLPRDPSASKRSKAARAAEKAAKAEASAAQAAPAPAAARAAPATAPAAPAAPVVPAIGITGEASHAAPKKPETAAMEADRKRADAHALGAALSARRQGHQKATRPVGFGATNEQPPELKVKGRFGRLAAEATARWPPRARTSALPTPWPALLLSPSEQRALCVPRPAEAAIMARARKKSPSSGS